MTQIKLTSLWTAKSGTWRSNGNGNSVALYRIYRDLASGQWFADASYD